jgi:hypothetical protein
MTWAFKKTGNFYAENCPKSGKIMTITSTPGLLAWKEGLPDDLF